MKYKEKEYRKIIVVGSPGSGKSYLAKEIHKNTGIPLIHLDKEYWNPGWHETPEEEWDTRIKEMVQQERWIIDGNYNRTLKLRFQEADLILFLDMNRWSCAYRIMRRHGKKRSDLPEYLEETFDREFVEFIKYTLEFPKKQRTNILELHKKYPQKEFIVLKSKRQIKEFIGGISEEGQEDIE